MPFCDAMIHDFGVVTGAKKGSYCRMKHEQSKSGRSSMRGKCQRIFFNAWNLHGMTGAKTISARSRKRLTAFNGILRLIEGGFSVSGNNTAKGV